MPELFKLKTGGEFLLVPARPNWFQRLPRRGKQAQETERHNDTRTT